MKLELNRTELEDLITAVTSLADNVAEEMSALSDGRERNDKMDHLDGLDKILDRLNALHEDHRPTTYWASSDIPSE